jgi:glycerol-3-phosphate dehydrogenase
LGNRRQPFVVLSGPSFAVELMNKLPTGLLISLILLTCCHFFFKLNVDAELFVPVFL